MLASKVFFYPFYFSGFTGGLCILATIIIFYYLYRKKNYGDIGCLALLLLPFLIIYGIGNVIDKRWEKLIELNFLSKQYNFPPSRTLKVLAALSCIGLWIMGIILLANFDDSGWWVAVWGIAMPFVYLYFFILWKKLFFVWLLKLRPQVARAIVWLSIALIVVFWVFAVRQYIHITSSDYLIQYWENKYLSPHEKK